ncbi:hypothetical protein R3W88_000639 [Solanum pinnatisectum]|uniref:Pyrrolo-quinoline quinone repeat domain-containing protein n=1 Tax=Solanum pinnatisectum TaxID=50273 RepID=A0AAV9MFX5_9SOLN|nr:hypothetical protein R3W88_000639 [Solanum pinnatisectum]
MASTHRKLVSFMIITFCLVIDHTSAEWLNHGGDITNRRSAPGEILISPRTINNLKLRWKFLAVFDITATPAVANGVVYFPSWNGNLYAVNALTGGLIWQQNLTRLTGLPPVRSVNVTVSRATPVVANDLLLVGIYGPAVVIAVRRLTGALVWSTLLDPRPLALITQSGAVLLGGYYVGVSSVENTVQPAAQCCTFRGSLVKLNVRTGAIIWQTYTLPDNGGCLGGYSGAAIWGSSPAIDIARGHVYVGTGNLYSAPPDVLKCQAAQNNQTTPPPVPDQCFGKDIHFDSILALDLNSGQIAWATQLGGYDVFTFACLVPNNPDCPPGPNMDADFGEAPMMLTIFSNGRIRDVVVAVQKSGFAWALDRNNGNIAWFKVKVPFTLAPSTQTTTAGGWVAMDANTGQILWTTANPSNETSPGPVTIVNGVLFAGSVAPNGPLYAMDASNGKILWTFNTGATIYGGASISYGCVFIGHGYSVGLAKLFHPTWTSGTSLFAFRIV